MKSPAVESIRRDRGALERLLASAGCVIRGKAIKCGFHDDKSPSGSIYEDGGVWRYKCFGCKVAGDVLDIQAIVESKPLADVFKATAGIDKPEPEKPSRTWPTLDALVASVQAYSPVSQVYRYTDPDTGNFDMAVLRIEQSDGEKKTFRQCRPALAGGWEQKAPNKPWPLYNRARLRRAESVVICEGEKAVHAFNELGIVATTSPGGSKNGESGDWKLVDGKREIIFWRDNDEAGMEFQNTVTAIIAKLPNAPKIRIVDVAALGLPPAGDIVEFIEKYDATDPKAAAECVIAEAESVGPAASVKKLIADTISGDRMAVPMPWPMLSRASQALLPGTTTVLCGEGGSSKTYWLLQLAAHFHSIGVPFAMQELEEDEEGSTLLRVLSQRSGEADLNQVDWVNENPLPAMEAYAQHEDFLNDFGRSLWAIPGNIPSLTDLVDWIRDRCKEGRRVVMIDPITAADGDGKPWVDDKIFLRNSQSLLRNYRASSILITHPKQASKSDKSSMDGIAGSAAYQRFSQNILMLMRVEEDEPIEVQHWNNYTGLTTQRVECNRKIRLCKVRNGKVSHIDIGYRFGMGMKFAEQGIIVKDGKTGSFPGVFNPKRDPT